MKIIYYYWGENTYNDMKEAFEKAGAEVAVTALTLTDYTDASQCATIFDGFMAEDVDFIFSFDYFPAICQYCHDHSIKYVSFVYDCPHYTLYSKTILYPELYLFIFDKIECEDVKALGAKHVFHQPLVANVDRLSKATFSDYKYNISFIGSLYSNTNYDQINYLPEDLKNYLDDIIARQCLTYDRDIIDEALTENIMSQVLEYVKLELDPDFSFNEKVLFSGLVRGKVSSLDRIYSLLTLAKYFDVDLFSGMDESMRQQIPETLKIHPPVDYYKQLPTVYKESAINLNVTMRSILSTWAIRCVDIMGSQAFLLSNYSNELEAEFIDGEDCVIYYGMDDLVNKADYYLKHDSLRQQIAANGFGKVKDKFTYQHAVSHIFNRI